MFKIFKRKKIYVAYYLDDKGNTIDLIEYDNLKEAIEDTKNNIAKHIKIYEYDVKYIHRKLLKEINL